MVSLSLLIHWNGLTSFIDFANNFSEICRTIELSLIDAVLVSSKNSINTVTLWAEDVSIESEAVTRLDILTFYELGSESIGWNLLIGIIILQNVTNCSDGLHVLVSGFVTHVVKGVRLVSLLV